MANRRDIQRALENRLELVKAGLTRRDLIKMGLMTSAGVLTPRGARTHAQTTPSSSARASNCYGNNCGLGCTPRPAQVFVAPPQTPPVLQARPLTDAGLQF